MPSALAELPDTHPDDPRFAPRPSSSTTAQEPPSPACVMSFNASDPSGAGGLAGDVATIAAMGAHALPVVTAIVVRDTAEVFDQHAHRRRRGRRAGAHHPRGRDDLRLEGRLPRLGRRRERRGGDRCPTIPTCRWSRYMPNLSWIEDDELQAYLDAFRELMLPATEVLVGNHKTLDRLAAARLGQRAAAVGARARGGRRRARHALRAGDRRAAAEQGHDQYIDNVLASPQGALTGEKFERFEASFVGAGDTLSAALAALLASGAELQAAVGEALAFLDQSLDAGFRPGMGNVVPDRFFWALPPAKKARQAPTAGEP